MDKRGQAAAAATLLAVIAVLMLLYILFLQPQDRAALLGEEISGNKSIKAGNVTLLTKNPGRIDFLAEKKVEHAISAVTVRTQTKGTVLEEKAELHLKKSLFSEVSDEFTFELDDIEYTENALLSFNILEAEGELIIFLNGNRLTEREIADANFKLAIPKNMLKDSNALKFSVSSPGAAFWRANEYKLTNVQVTADIINIQGQRSKSLFSISSMESNNMEKATLKFQPDCDESSVAPLNIWVNQYNLYSAVPECGIRTIQMDVSAAYLNTGSNELVFSTERGEYYIGHIAMETQLKQLDFPVFYFELSEDQYKAVNDRKKDVIASISFVDTTERKQGQLIINGHIEGFDTLDLDITEILSDDVVRGNNAIKIKPERRSLDIRELRITLANR